MSTSPKWIDMTGNRYGMWSVISISHSDAKGAYWKCRCDCGTERAVIGNRLRRGQTNSCGCRVEPTKCSVHGCERAARNGAMCSSHYARQKRHGTPTGGRKTYNGEVDAFIELAIKCKDDKCLIWPFARATDGRAKTGHGGIVTRRICAAVNGPPPSPELEAAHNCGRGHDACVNGSHLRWATRKENEADKIIHRALRRSLTDAQDAGKEG